MDPDCAERVDERRERAVARTDDLALDTVDLHHRSDGVGTAVDLGRIDLLPDPLQGTKRRQVLLGEDVPHLLR